MLGNYHDGRYDDMVAEMVVEMEEIVAEEEIV
jgi:hypothetical protein